MATPEEKTYFARIAAQNQSIVDTPPASLQEAFDRLDQTAARLGELTKPGRPKTEGDLASHLSYLQRLRALDPDYNAFIA
jgi:hypothetical protein